MRNYKGWGPIEVFEFFHDWREERQACIEAGIAIESPLTALGLDVLESPETRADFQTFLWEPMAASFYEGWDVVSSPYDRYTGRTSLRSFDVYREKGWNGLSGVGRVGELGSYPALRRTFRPEVGIALDTYGATYALTRRLMRTHGVEKLLAENPRDIGQAMADYVTRMIVAFIVANPNAPDGVAMAHASRGNITTDALDETSLVNAVVWLRTQRDTDGRPIRGGCQTVVVQNDRPALRIRQVLESQELLTAAGGTVTPSDQWGRGKSNPLRDAQLIPSDGVVIDPWYDDANDVRYFGAVSGAHAAFKRAYLDGEDRPMIGMADETVMHLSNSNASGFDPYDLQTDAITYKTRHDFGLQAYEPMTYYLQAPA